MMMVHTAGGDAGDDADDAGNGDKADGVKSMRWEKEQS